VKKCVLLFIAAVFLFACSPSPQAIQTAIAQTQEANPTSTFTPFPSSTYTPTNTATGTPTNSITPSRTPDLLLLQLNLKDFLLQQSDFPLNANYLSIANGLQSIPNEKVDSAFVKETGRIDGWSVWYGKDFHNGGWYVTISDEVNLYQTSSGAQIAVYKDFSNLYTEEINPPKIGDSTHAWYYLIPQSSQATYVIRFSYRNCVHVVQGVGLDNEVAVFTREIAHILLAKIQASSLINP
jgi:hypothetical protein